jgi:hypothetical protein
MDMHLWQVCGEHAGHMLEWPKKGHGKHAGGAIASVPRGETVPAMTQHPSQKHQSDKSAKSGQGGLQLLIKASRGYDPQAADKAQA